VENDVVNLKVFNRWGNLVYEQDNYKNNWDGTSNKGINGNGVLPDGTYFYIIDLNNGEKPYVGSVTIKR
jgi:gliding motility-associated-like protein